MRFNQRLDAIGAPAENHGRQEWVGRRFDVTGKGARKWMRGEALPRTDSIARIAEILRCDPCWLLFGVGSPEPRPVTDVQEPAADYQDAMDPRALAVARAWQQLPAELQQHHAALINATLAAVRH